MYAAADAGGDENVWQTCATVAQAALPTTGGNDVCYNYCLHPVRWCLSTKLAMIN